MKFYLTPKSKNRKTGPIPVTTSPMKTCPVSCPLKNRGCYAEGGPLYIHWGKITEGKRGVGWGDFLCLVSRLPKGQLWRHNQAGDLRGSKNKIAPKALRDLAKANKGKRGFTYTHYPTLGNTELARNNRELIKEANQSGFTISVSADAPKQVDKLADLEIGPVVTTLESSTSQGRLRTAAGRKIVVCPAMHKEDMTCEKCGLCAKYPRETVLGFLSHGTQYKKVDQLIQQIGEIDG